MAAFLVGAGMNGILPARGGDALKIVLAKRSVERSSYPTIISSFAALAPFDTAIGVARPAVRDHPGAAAASAAAPAPAGVRDHLLGRASGSAAAAAHAGRDRGRRPDRDPLPSGRVLLAAASSRAWRSSASPRRYLREVAAWQLVGWLLPLRLVLALPRGVPHRRLGPERAPGDERPVDHRRAAVHPGRRRRAAGAARGHARRSLARGGPLLLGRPAARGHRLVGGDRLRSAPATSSESGTGAPWSARAKPPGPRPAPSSPRAASGRARTRRGSACPSSFVPSSRSSACSACSASSSTNENRSSTRIEPIASSGITAPSVSAQRTSVSSMPLRLPRLTNSFTSASGAGSSAAAAACSAAVLAAPRARGVLEPLLGRLPLADPRLRLALDAADLGALLRGHEGDRPPGAPDPPRAPDPVHVAIGGVGDVVVDHVGDVLDVEPAGGDVGRDQQPQPVVLEGEHHAVALALAHVAVQRLDLEAAAAQRLVEPRRADLRAAEDDRLLGLLGPQHLDQAVDLARAPGPRRRPARSRRR